MTTEVLFDTWAWWEVLWGTPTGRRIGHRFLGHGRVVTSAWALAELAAKLEAAGLGGRIPAAVSSVRGAGRLVDVTPEVALEGAALRALLRRKAKHASLGDGVMLATAHRLGVRLVSGDGAFAGQKDVIRA